MLFDKKIFERKKKVTPDEAALKKLSAAFLKFFKEKFNFRTDNIDAEELEKVMRWVAHYRIYACEVAKDPSNRQHVDNCAIHLPTKGLFIVGKPGRGKSTIATIIATCFQFHYFSVVKLDDEYAQNPERCKSEYWEAFDRNSPIVLDDLGAEEGGKHYGRPPVAPVLLEKLYESWKWYDKQIIVTSNLSTQPIADPRTVLGCYGPRIESRIFEMFEIVKFVGPKDLRKEA